MSQTDVTMIPNMEGLVYIATQDSQTAAAIERSASAQGLPTRVVGSLSQVLEEHAWPDPCCVVTDANRLCDVGPKAYGAAMGSNHSLPLIVLSGNLVARSVEAMRQGALACLPAKFDDQNLAKELRGAIEHDTRNHGEEQQRRDVQQRLTRLSDGERLVLELMLSGLANKVIARRLGVSERTVEKRRHDIFHKLEADSLVELVRLVAPLIPVAELEDSLVEGD